ncbi:exoribonuclease II [Pantoea sp. Aalb]|uniref:exoribonuclease II n=1 Tax=Pantoea sp. Aalb TaxID=2576762 RepID=UPI00132BA9D0|nr:exoribonuclease II [Pantoea sp. Aalb]MXP67402.1 exoribonuclease II [Pantoea sp. Aalb]
MFHDNPLLTQLKKKLHALAPRVEGIVRSTEKGFGFLEVDSQKSYFIPPLQMKKVMHSDRIIAVIYTDKDRKNAEPESLVEPFLTRFVGRIQKKNSNLLIIPDHPLLKNPIQCRLRHDLIHDFKVGDWAVAEMCSHPLKNNGCFSAELTEFITTSEDYFAPWWVTLSRYNLEREAPKIKFGHMLEENLQREDLTEMTFITIDSADTKDIDDALYITKTLDEKFSLNIAIADPTCYIAQGSNLDILASQRVFTNYLPGFNIPMLPRDLSDNICSLHQNVRRPVLVCHVNILKDGSMEEDITFFTAWIESKATLVYNNVSDWLENIGSWTPANKDIANQINLLNHLCLARFKWRQTNALVFKDRPDYHFLLDEKGKVLDIILEHRRIANRIIEETMILANICAAKFLQKKLGFGIYTLHAGFNLSNVVQVVDILCEHGIKVDQKEITTLEGFRQIHRKLDAQPTQYLDNRIRRFYSFVEISTEPGPHFALGLESYATWTSPIRKFGDMINHRLLKAIIRGDTNIRCPQNDITITISERRRLHRMAERDINDWLYAYFLLSFAGTSHKFTAEIIDVLRSGMRVRIQENGANAYIPATFIHTIRDDLIFVQESGTIYIKDKIIYRVTDIINITISQVRMETRSIIANLAI